MACDPRGDAYSQAGSPHESLGVAEEILELYRTPAKGKEREIYDLAMSYLSITAFVMMLASKNIAPRAQCTTDPHDWENRMMMMIQLAAALKKAITSTRDSCTDVGWTPDCRPGCFVRQPAKLACSACKNPMPSIIRARVSFPNDDVQRNERMTATVRIQIVPNQSSNCPRCNTPLEPKLYLTEEDPWGTTLKFRPALEYPLAPGTKENLYQAFQLIQQASNAVNAIRQRQKFMDETTYIFTTTGMESAVLLISSVAEATFKKSNLLDRTRDGLSILEITTRVIRKNLEEAVEPIVLGNRANNAR